MLVTMHSDNSASSNPLNVGLRPNARRAAEAENRLYYNSRWTYRVSLKCPHDDKCPYTRARPSVRKYILLDILVSIFANVFVTVCLPAHSAALVTAFKRNIKYAETLVLGLGLSHRRFDFTCTHFTFLFLDMNELSILSTLQYSIFWYE